MLQLKLVRHVQYSTVTNTTNMLFYIVLPYYTFIVARMYTHTNPSRIWVKFTISYRHNDHNGLTHYFLRNNTTHWLKVSSI